MSELINRPSRAGGASLRRPVCRWLWLGLLMLIAPAGWAQLPVLGNSGAHDPSTMIKDGTRYYIFTTGKGIPNKYSTDLRNWTAGPQVLPSGPPVWATNAVPGYDPNNWAWAPDIAYFNGRYNLYYSISQWGTIDSAIGLLTSPSLQSPVWTDQGKVVQSDAVGFTDANTDLTAYNCIDPGIMVDTNGTVWMSFGSYSSGILIMQLDPATGKRLNTNSLTVYQVANNAVGGGWGSTEEGSCLYQRGGYYYLFLNFGGCCAGIDSTYNIRVGRSPSVTGPFYDQAGVNLRNGGGTMLLESTARFIGPGHAAIMNDNGTNWFTFHYYDGNASGNPKLGLMQLNWTADGWPALTNDWSAFYPLNADAREHLGLYNGTLQGGSALTNEPARGNVLNLNGTTNFVSLPAPVANCSTLATWVKWNGGSDWQRIFDFGADTTNYFFLTPRTSAGKLRFAITTNGPAAEKFIDAATALPTNSWCHVAVTLDGTKGLLYLNGNPVGTNASLTVRPWQTMARSNYLGKSQFAADPLFNGRLDSFRIYGRALSGAEIRDLAWAHPALAHRYSFTSNVWDSIGMAHGSLAGNAMVTNRALQLTGASGGYANLPGGLVSGSSVVTLEFWATFGTSGSWARVVDFGNLSGTSGSQYFFFSPHTGTSARRMELSTNTTTTYDLPGTLDGRTVQVVGIVDPANSYAAVYTNGVLEKATNAFWPAFSSVSPAWSFIGRSLFSSDAYLNASIDELRLYDGRLTPAEIAADCQFGPDSLALPVTLLSSNSTAGLTLSWPSWAVGFTLQATTNLSGGVWTTNAAILANDQWSVTLGKTNAAKFFQLQR